MQNIKPKEVIRLVDIFRSSSDFNSLSIITSGLNPYGLRKDFSNDSKVKKSTSLSIPSNSSDQFTIYDLKNGQIVKSHLSNEHPIQMKLDDVLKYKIFVPYAWGNVDEKYGLGGDFSEIIIGRPMEIVTTSYLTQGSYDDLNTAKKHAKYLLTRFLRALLYNNKHSQHIIKSWSDVPIQNFNEQWWNLSIEEIDRELMKKYNVPDEVSKFIYKTFKLSLKTVLLIFYNNK